jgi:hypothetical protein
MLLDIIADVLANEGGQRAQREDGTAQRSRLSAYKRV